MMTVQKTLEWGVKNPQKLLCIDGVGALLSAFLLGCVIGEFESVFGIPNQTLRILAILPCVFAASDFYCYFRKDVGLEMFLFGIGAANITYCCLTVILVTHHLDIITNWGILYFGIEMVIVFVLADLELKVASIFRQTK